MSDTRSPLMARSLFRAETPACTVPRTGERVARACCYCCSVSPTTIPIFVWDLALLLPGCPTAAVCAVHRTAALGAFVFVISDADLARYGKTPNDWNRILTGTPSVKAYAVLIASNESEAERIRDALAPGRGYVCTDTSQLAATFEQIFHASVAASD